MLKGALPVALNACIAAAAAACCSVLDELAAHCDMPLLPAAHHQLHVLLPQLNQLHLLLIHCSLEADDLQHNRTAVVCRTACMSPAWCAYTCRLTVGWVINWTCAHRASSLGVHAMLVLF
jgi:hypothetical protein